MAGRWYIIKTLFIRRYALDDNNNNNIQYYDYSTIIYLLFLLLLLIFFSPDIAKTRLRKTHLRV